MKIRVTMEFDVVETREGIEIHDDQDFCLTRGQSMKEAMDDLRSLITEHALTGELEVQVVDVIDARTQPETKLKVIKRLMNFRFESSVDEDK